MSRPTLRYPKHLHCRVRGCHPVSRNFPEPSTSTNISYSNWALPISLAATFGISVDFFSSGYLDVSVPRVRFINLCIQLMIPDKSGRLPHSEILGSMRICQLPEAYRRLSRPSSPLTAKAFVVCAYSLDHIISNSLLD